jgi:hypothetical protein
LDVETHAGRGIWITRRALVGALLASGALGVGIGELAAPLSPSQAHPAAVAAAVPAACDTFAVNVGHAFTILGTILVDASRYPAFIPQAASAGAAHNNNKLNSIAGQVTAVTSEITSQAKHFTALKGPIISEEKQCLG